MSRKVIDTGIVGNDGTGDSIRAAFQTVNQNFSFVQGGLFAGTELTIINALSVVSQTISTETFAANTLVGNTVTSNGNLFIKNIF